MAVVKGYVRAEGLPKIRGTFTKNTAPKVLRLRGISGNVILEWNVPTGVGVNYVETTNQMSSNNEILFKVPKNVQLGLLELKFSDSGYPLFAHWVLEGNGGTINQDHALLYSKIRLTFAYATGDV